MLFAFKVDFLPDHVVTDSSKNSAYGKENRGGGEGVLIDGELPLKRN